MKLIVPQEFSTSTTLVSSNAVETAAAWSSATTYAKDAIVDYGTFYWISLVNSNTNNIPSAPGSTFWALVGPDNTHAMFDGQVATATTSATPLIVTIRAPLANAVAFVGLVGTELTVELTDNGASPPLYTKTVSLDGSIVFDWYTYFFDRFFQIAEVVLTDLPPYSQGQITMTLSGAPGSNVAVGEVLWGSAYQLADEAMEQGATVGIIDYSRKDTDPDTGKVTFTRRAFSKRMSGQFLVDNRRIAAVQSLLADVRAVPSVFIGSEDTDYSPLIVYGFYRDFSIDIAYPTKSWCRIEVEGLI